MTKLWMTLGALAVLVTAGALWFREHDRRVRAEATLDARLEELALADTQLARQSVLLIHLAQRSSDTATKYIERWRSITQRVPYPVPGGVDSVYLDSAFAALPDSTKVRILREVGSQVANACALALKDCAAQRAVSDSLLGVRAQTIRELRDAYASVKPKMIGLGAHLGAGACYLLNDPEKVTSRWQLAPQGGVGINIRF